MADPTSDSAGTTPAKGEPADGADEAQTQTIPASETPTQAISAAEAAAPAAAAPAAATPVAGGPSGPWYRRRWALITGTAVAAGILFLGGMAVGDAVWGDDGPDGVRGERPGMFREDGDHRAAPPGMGQGGRGLGDGAWGDGGWGQGRQDQGMGHGRRDGSGHTDPGDRPEAPGVTPSPSSSPQSFYQ